MVKFWELFRRGLFFRCPVCGKGKLFNGLFRMNETCPVCGFKFEREEGYYTSSIAIDLVISELIVTIAILPFAANLTVPVIPLVIWGAILALILPFIFFRHSRSLWMAMDHYLHPVSNAGLLRHAQINEANQAVTTHKEIKIDSQTGTRQENQIDEHNHKNGG